MSGGFFRGTSADQDTRFSNKQAKLMKSQKFAPELEHLVDMSKVEMDVMRPWIAKRVTELLGFEDEVLINFIYSLLEEKVVNGKKIQISITGFMEKNTGKFMKELWTLLLSAQNNASHVPQQFLDAKEEETRSKKAEADRIKNEVQRVKEKEDRALEQEKMDKMDDKVEKSSRDNKDTYLTSSRHQTRDSSIRSEVDEKQMNDRNGSRGRTRDSPSRSNSKSFSTSRSHSHERHRSRSISRSPKKSGRSVSSEKVLHSPSRRSATPGVGRTPRRSFSPPGRRTSQFRQRLNSHSPSPVGRRLRSPMQHRSRSPVRYKSRMAVRRRSRTPQRRTSRSPRYRSRSPIQRRSRSPQRRSPSPRRWSPSPIRRRYRRSPSPYRRSSRSPYRRGSRSPYRRGSRSPYRRRSRSPYQRRSRSPYGRRSPSPYRRRPTIPSRRRSPIPHGRRSSSRQRSSSESPIHSVSPSLVKRRSPKSQRSPMQSPRNEIRSTISNLKSPPRDSSGQKVSCRKVSLSPSPYNSLSGTESPPASRKRSLSQDRRLSSPHQSPRRKTREHIIQNSRPSPLQVPIVHKVNSDDGSQEEKTKVSREGEDRKYESSGKKLTQPSASHELKLDQLKKSEPRPKEVVAQSEARKQVSPTDCKSTLPSEGTLESYAGDGNRADKSQYRPRRSNGSEQQESETKMSKVEERHIIGGSVDSDSEISDKRRAEVAGKRKHKRSKTKRRESDDDDSFDSEVEGRKEAKRRKKEEKRLRKEERRRRRDERRQRKEDRRAEKIKLKSLSTVSPPSDIEEDHDDYNCDGERVPRREAEPIGIAEAESDPKKLEISLREKALGNFIAKMGAGL